MIFAALSPLSCTFHLAHLPTLSHPRRHRSAPLCRFHPALAVPPRPAPSSELTPTTPCAGFIPPWLSRLDPMLLESMQHLQQAAAWTQPLREALQPQATQRQHVPPVVTAATAEGAGDAAAGTGSAVGGSGGAADGSRGAAADGGGYASASLEELLALALLAEEVALMETETQGTAGRRRGLIIGEPATGARARAALR